MRAAAAALAATLVLAGTLACRAPASVSEATFVGVKACTGCHADESRAWKGSHHDLAMAEATEATVRGDFAGARFEADDLHARFFRDGSRFLIETEGADGKPAVFEVAYTFGWEPLQQYLVRFPGGRLQAFSVAWDVPRRRWFFLYPGRKIPRSDWLHWTRNGQNWNGMCAECHSTNLVKGLDPTTGTYRTTWSEIDVGCEACHGPGSLHVTWADTPPDSRRPIEHAGFVVPLAGLDKRAIVERCAPCHARRTELDDPDPRGSDLLQSYLPALLSEGLYHPDGQIQDEVFEYGSFVQSRMYREGVGCTDCHDAHSLRLRREGNALCLECHEAGFDTPAHHHHETARCVDCHMPKSPFMVVHLRADHSLRVPRPDLTRELGTPNACGSAGCHADRPLAWIESAYDRWYGPGREPHYGSVLAAGRRGDPQALPGLLALAADPELSGILRSTALSLLGRQSGNEVDDAIRRALADPDPLVRRTAVASARFAGEEERIARLTALLHDPTRAVRLEAGFALAGTPPERLAVVDRGALDAAVAEYARAMQHALDFPHGAHHLGLLRERLGDPAGAEARYRQAIAIDDRWAPSKVNLARILGARGETREAERLLREVVAAEPELYEAAYSLGLLLAESGSMEEAADWLARAAEGMPRNARAAYNAGLALAAAGRAVPAETMLRRAVALDPSSYDALFALADFLLGRGRRAETLPLADRMDAVAPGRPEAAQLRARANAR